MTVKILANAEHCRREQRYTYQDPMDVLRLQPYCLRSLQTRKDSERASFCQPYPSRQVVAVVPAPARHLDVSLRAFLCRRPLTRGGVLPCKHSARVLEWTSRSNWASPAAAVHDILCRQGRMEFGCCKRRRERTLDLQTFCSLAEELFLQLCLISSRLRSMSLCSAGDPCRFLQAPRANRITPSQPTPLEFSAALKSEFYKRSSKASNPLLSTGDGLLLEEPLRGSI